ncbi:MAG: ATP-binding protein [Lentimicrobiaceae bacterium]|nr:ATP-binding protein [Lentimicrobiaceae bacterium]
MHELYECKPNYNNNNNKYQEYIGILEANKNLILNGAPGTGKTWIAKEIAKNMGCSDNEIVFGQSPLC